MREAIKADSRHYHRLRFGDRQHWWTWLALWVSSPGLLVIATYRMDRYLIERRSQGTRSLQLLPLKILLRICHYALVLIAKADITARSQIETEVYISDLGHAILGPQRIGKGSMIHHRVTMGTDPPNDAATPIVGNDVWIGPDCVIYGSITIGDGATLLPGTVLSKSVPAKAVMEGNPARLVKTNFDNSSLRRSLDWKIDSKSIAEHPQA
jgi:serine acetyltransferase